MGKRSESDLRGRRDRGVTHADPARADGRDPADPAELRPVVAICGGKDCRRRCEFAEMRHALGKRCEVVEFSCVGICKGPVVVADATSPEPIVFARVRTKKQRKQLLRVARHGAVPTADLARLEVGAKQRRTTLRRVDRALRRTA